jgi:hypothetical protein
MRDGIAPLRISLKACSQKESPAIAGIAGQFWSGWEPTVSLLLSPSFQAAG